MAADSPRPNVLTIPAGAAFLPTLAAGLLDGALIPGFAPRGDPIALADATVFLPTRRAARALRDAFLEALDGRATLLPRIAPLGDVDEDADIVEPLGEADGDLAPAVAPFERRLALARLVSAFAGALDRSILHLKPEDGPLVPATSADAIHLAGDLERLIDAIETEEVDIAALDALIPGEHDSYWAITQKFLQVALADWPRHLNENGRLDPAVRRRLQIEAAAVRAAASRGPVVAAGSTGSAPAVRRLMRAIARHENGAVVLPGLDRDGLEDTAWRELTDGRSPGLHGHPQRGLAQLLTALGVDRGEVRTLGTVAPALCARAALVADALRPAETTDAWAEKRLAPGDVEAAFGGLTIVEAATFRGEAAAIAVALREAVATPGRTAALVTPDRALAARVAIELERWDIAVDDSAGRPLAATPAGALLRLCTEAALDPRPDLLLALLRAPACRLAADAPRAVDMLDVTAFRATWPSAGFAGLRGALSSGEEAPPSPPPPPCGEGKGGGGSELSAPADRRATSASSPHPEPPPPPTPPRRGEGGRAARRFGPADREAAKTLVDRLEAALAPLMAASETSTAPLERLVGALAHGFSALVGEAETEDAEAVRGFLDELEGAAGAGDPIAPLAFPGVVEALMAGRALRPPREKHPRLKILGPLEARLLRFDLVVMGSLNEGVWPPVPQADPWINRPLRTPLGLAPPERRIGLSAHDFSQGLGADEVVLTRAAKVAGAPAIPARWLQRLAAVAAGPAHEAALARGRRLVRLADRLDETPRAASPRPPEPRPPLALRPARLSVTAVETWLRDPYSIYARHILRLDELEEVGPEPGPGDLGNAVHGALEAFARSGVPLDDKQAREKLLAFGRAAFGRLLDRDEARTLWWPRFEKIVDWTLAFHRGRATRVAEAFVEQEGAYAFETVAGRRFTLTARADRIEAFADGSYAILDYKTGAVPTAKQALAGFAPQLPLEGAILREGGFASVTRAGSPIGELSLLKLAGREPAGEIVELRSKTKGPDEAAAEALTRFREVANRFEDEAEPYRSLSHPQFLKRPDGPYAHLARVKEWSATGGQSEGEAE